MTAQPALRPAPRPQVPAAPVPLAPREAQRFDAGALGRFCRAHGPDAEARIADDLARIEERLSLAAWQARQGEAAGLRRSAEALAALARPLGMTTLAAACDGVLDTLGGGSEAAVAACAARLGRLAAQGAAGGTWRIEHDGGDGGDAPLGA